MGGKHHHRARERGIKKNGPEKRVPEPAADSGSARGPSAAELPPAAEAAVRARRPKAPLSDLIIKIILLLLTAACMAAVVQAVWERMEKTPEQIRPEAAEQPEETVITVNAWTVAPETMVQTVKLNGDVSSKSEISLYADTSGKLVSYTVSVGSAVKRGDVVAYIDPSKPGAPYSVNPVRSTIDGTVISLPYTLGDTLSSSSPVATVGNLDDLQIIAYASEKYASVLRTGATADVVLAAYPERTFRAFVSQVSPVVDVSSRSIEIRLDISPARREVKPGMFASVTLVARRITGAKIHRILGVLTGEIRKTLTYLCRKNHLEKNACVHLAEQTALALIAELPEIRRKVSLDAKAALEGDPAARSVEEVILSYPGLEAVVVHRIAHFLHEKGIPVIPRIMSECIHGKTGIDIHPGAEIGESFFIDHGTGVVIGETCVIGARVKVYQGVTLGALSVSKNLADKKRHPTIEDDVTIYANATILGGNTVIGRGSVIGGNTWITKSVPPGSTVYN